MTVDGKISRSEFDRVYGDAVDREAVASEDFAALDEADGELDGAIDLGSDRFAGIETADELASLIENHAPGSAARLRQPNLQSFNQAASRLGLIGARRDIEPAAEGSTDGADPRAEITDRAINLGLNESGQPRYSLGTHQGPRRWWVAGERVEYENGTPLFPETEPGRLRSELDAMFALTLVDGVPDPELVAHMIERLEAVPREHRRLVEHVLQQGVRGEEDLDPASTGRAIYEMVDVFGDQALAVSRLFTETPRDRLVAAELSRTTVGLFTEEQQLNQELAALRRRHTRDGLLDRQAYMDDLRAIAVSYALRPNGQMESLNAMLNWELSSVMGTEEMITQGITYPDGAAASATAALSSAYAEHGTAQFMMWFGTLFSDVDPVDGDSVIDVLQGNLASSQQVGALVWNYLEMTRGGEWSEMTPIIPPSEAAFPLANAEVGLRNVGRFRNTLAAHFRMTPDQVARLDSILGVGPATFNSQLATGRTPDGAIGLIPPRLRNVIYMDELPGLSDPSRFAFSDADGPAARAELERRAEEQAALGLGVFYGDRVPSGSFAWVVNEIGGRDGALTDGRHFVYDGERWSPVFEVGTLADVRETTPPGSYAYVRRLGEDDEDVAYGGMVRHGSGDRVERLDRELFNYDDALVYGARYADHRGTSAPRYPAPGTEFGEHDYSNVRLAGHLEASIASFLEHEPAVYHPQHPERLAPYTRQIEALAARLEAGAALTTQVGDRRYLETDAAERRAAQLDALTEQLNLVESALSAAISDLEMVSGLSGHPTMGGMGVRDVLWNIDDISEQRIAVQRALAAIGDLRGREGDVAVGSRLHQMLGLRQMPPEDYYRWSEADQQAIDTDIGYLRLSQGAASPELQMAAQILAGSGSDREAFMRAFLTDGYGREVAPGLPEYAAAHHRYRVGLGAREPISPQAAAELSTERGPHGLSPLEQTFLRALLGSRYVEPTEGNPQGSQAQLVLTRAIQNYEGSSLTTLLEDSPYLGIAPSVMHSEEQVAANAAALGFEPTSTTLRMVQQALRLRAIRGDGERLRSEGTDHIVDVFGDMLNAMTPDEQAAFRATYNAIATQQHSESPDAFMELVQMLGPADRGSNWFSAETEAAIRDAVAFDVTPTGWSVTGVVGEMFDLAGEAVADVNARQSIQDIMRQSQAVFTLASYDASEEVVEEVTRMLYWQRATVVGERQFLNRTTTGIEDRYEEYIAAASSVRSLQSRIAGLDDNAANYELRVGELQAELGRSVDQLAEQATRLRASFDSFWGEREELLEIYGEVAMAPVGVAGLVVTGGASGAARLGVTGTQIIRRGVQAAERTRRFAMLSIQQAAHPRYWAYAGLARASAMSVGGLDTSTFRDEALLGATMYGAGSVAFLGLAHILSPAARYAGHAFAPSHRIDPAQYTDFALAMRPMSHREPGVAALIAALDPRRPNNPIPPEFSRFLGRAGISDARFERRLREFQQSAIEADVASQLSIAELRTAALLSILADDGVSNTGNAATRAAVVRDGLIHLQLDLAARARPGHPRSPYLDAFSGTLRQDLEPAELDLLTATAASYRDEGARLIDSARPNLGSAEAQDLMLRAQSSYRDAYAVFSQLGRTNGDPHLSGEALVMGVISGPRASPSADVWVSNIGRLIDDTEVRFRAFYDSGARSIDRTLFPDADSYVSYHMQTLRDRALRDLGIMMESAAIDEAHVQALRRLLEREIR
ncbi:MAG: hypothetical protein AAGJ56_08350 [Myxococcota bacterium]